MRPLRVELEGIGSFRERTVLDLTDVDLFALSGPTGAGKTTLLVDAMMLALYGTIPRYDDRRLVAPAITQGANEGRVRLTFSVGERRFTATRIVRRTKQGATTKEARLEEITGGGSVVRAGSADEVSAAVGALLGLSFDQFCRSVVLPQGAFDRFLFAKPAERGDLLLQLLDLRLHEEVGRRARDTANRARAEAEAAQRRLDGDLAGADPGEVERLDARLRRLDELAGRCREVQGQLDELRDQGGALRTTADRAAGERDALTGLSRPADVDALAAATRAAAATVVDAEDGHGRASAAVAAAETARAQLPDADALAELARTGTELTAATDALPPLVAAATAAEAAARRAAATLETADAEVDAAEAARDEARRAELVHAVTEGLHAGDDCPVCGATLADDPPRSADQRTQAATARLEEARAARSEASAAHREAERDAATAAERHRAGERRVQEAHDARAAARERVGVTDDDAADDMIERSRLAEEALAAARAEERAARERVAEARRRHDAARAREEEAWQQLDRARDTVAALGPPSPSRDDLATAWDALLTWSAEALPAAISRADEAEAAVQRARQRYHELRTDLHRECSEADVPVATGASAEAAVSEAVATTRSRRDALVERVEQVRRETARRDAAREEATVADHLGKLLRADGFSRWLLARALTRLVSGASSLLRDLSSGAYSLALDGTNQFLVVDHRNADEPRTVRSLSGGERFLASLALALALADHVAELAADGAARLESLFLDEGFGTLDPDTLDVVAAALEELGSRGRVVGIVTHVRDLAERLPVRFEVAKGPNGSHVRRVDEGAVDPVTGTDADTETGTATRADATTGAEAGAVTGTDAATDPGRPPPRDGQGGASDAAEDVA